jgi:type I restriction enzyme S subunit
MMKRLGDYIRPVDLRNRDLKVTRLVGLTIDKAFIPSVANTIGTDLSNYKVISENQFACSLMQVSRDGKMPIAMFKGEPCIMSPAYPMFEVSKTNELLPEYLMMWFSRSEFDREASFYAVGGVRGSLEWNDFCDMQIPVPAIEKQREIVAEYNTLATRIETNKKLIATLEQTAQTLYRHTFVDNIDPNNLPDGWRMGTLGEIAKVKVGGDKPDVFSEEKSEKCKIPIYSNGLENKGIYGYTDKATIFEKCVTVSARGTIGYCCLRDEPFVPIVRLLVVIPNDENMVDYLYRQLKDLNFEGSGSVQNQLTAPHIENQEILIPASSLFKEYNEKLNPVMTLINNKEQENQNLTQMQTLLLSKMGV